jgi:hypothetical protein
LVGKNTLAATPATWKSIMLPLRERPNMALNLAPFSRWTLRDKSAQRRLALRYSLSYV